MSIPLIVSMFMEALAPEAAAIKCEFPAETVTEKAISITLEPRPSLKDQPGLFRVLMDLNHGAVSVRAAAQPITSTDDRDILVRGVTARRSIYTIGLREDGMAALNMKTKSADTTRVGACRNFETHFNRWLS